MAEKLMVQEDGSKIENIMNTSVHHITVAYISTVRTNDISRLKYCRIDSSKSGFNYSETKLYDAGILCTVEQGVYEYPRYSKNYEKSIRRKKVSSCFLFAVFTNRWRWKQSTVCDALKMRVVEEVATALPSILKSRNYSKARTKIAVKEQVGKLKQQMTRVLKAQTHSDGHASVEVARKSFQPIQAEHIHGDSSILVGNNVKREEVGTVW